MNREQANKGFTLIEIIVVLVILVISALFGVSSLRGFTKNAEQKAREDVARTIFMAAQTALTQKYNQDRDFSLTGFRGSVINNEEFVSALHDPREQDKARALELVQLASNPGNPSQELLDWLSPQMNDKEALTHAILIEYDKETGRVLSAFYSEKTIEGTHVTLGHGNGASYDVSIKNNREQEALEAGYVGYFGVDYTGERIRIDPIAIEDFSILFRDYTEYGMASATEPYGVLTAEITMPNDADKLDPAFTYTLEMTADKGTGKEVVTFSDTDASADFTLQQLLTTHSNLDDAIKNPIEHNGKRIVAYRESAGGSGGGAAEQKLIIVLDCVQSYGTYTAAQNMSIRTNYPNLINGYLEGALTIDDGTIPKTTYSSEDMDKQVHALFLGQNDEGAYEIVSVRHLNNIRYQTEKAKYIQTENLYLQTYDRAQLNFTPLCNGNDPRPDGVGDGEYGFTGAFSNSGDYRIYDLHIELQDAGNSGMTLQNAGLFDTIRQGASVTGVRFATTAANGLVLPVNPAGVANRTAYVRGIAAAGGIAGVNNGRIERCTVLGKIVAVNETGESIAGGIAGGNGANGVITNCFAGAEVRAGKYVGGITGSSLGEIYACEAGTASRRVSTDRTKMYLTGVPFFGARIGQQSAYLKNETANNTFRVVIEQDGGAAGGIAGALFEGATVKNCVSACKVESGNEDDDTQGEQVNPYSNGIAGGIVGYVGVNDATSTTVSYCYNAGAVYATKSAGGIVGELHRGRLENSYNSGYVNRRFAIADVGTTRYYLPGTPINISDGNTYYQSGGVVGYGSGEEIAISDCYSAQYAGNRYGGAFGVLNRTAVRAGKISNCCFLQNILDGTNQFYWQNGVDATPQLVPDVDNPLRIYTHKNLREAPTTDKLSSNAFSPGGTSPGIFGYSYPTLRVDSGKASDGHRTPYNPIVENYGWVQISGNVNNLNTGVITTKFGVTPDKEAMLKFIVRTDTGDHKTFYVPIGKYQDDFATLHRHADGNYGNDDFDYVYGYTFLPPDAQPDVSESEHTLEIKTFTATEATDGYDGYKYAVYFNTNASAKVHDRLLENLTGNLTKLEVWLYNAEKGLGSDDYVDYDYWPVTQGRIWLQTSLPTVRELCFNPIQGNNNGKTTITFTYDGHPDWTQTIEMTGSDWNNAPSSYLDAITKFARVSPIALRLVGSSEKRFPYYVTTSGGETLLHVVLWYSFAGAYRQPNGLHDGTNVTISITKNGVTLSQDFNRLE